MKCLIRSCYLVINSQYSYAITSKSDISGLLRESKTSVDYGNGTLLNQFCRLHNVILFGLEQVESRLSQTLSEKVENCQIEGSNSRR